MRPFIDAQEQWSRYFQRVIALCPLSQPLLKPLSLDQRQRRGEEEGGGGGGRKGCFRKQRFDQSL